MAKAQPVPIDVQFLLLDVQDPYKTPFPPLPNETVRLVLGESPTWQDPDAGHKFTTDAKGEANFTLPALMDTRWQWRNIGFTPFSKPVRSDHFKIGVELQQTLPLEKGPDYRARWFLTMDLDCFHGAGTCSTVGFMGIYTPDDKGRFTRALAREGGREAWTVPELNGKVIWGMGYQVADFLMSADSDNPNKRTLRLAIKRLPRPISR